MPRSRKFLFLTGIIIFFTGLVASTTVYLMSAHTSGVEEGPDTANSKVYLHDLELYGGKANLLASEFMSWFSGLWQGKTLAYTIAGITVVLSALIFSCACFVCDAEPEDRNEGDSDDND